MKFPGSTGKFHPRKAWLCGCVGFFVACVGVRNSAGQVYDVIELPALSGDVESTGVAINNVGQIVGVSTQVSGKQSPVVWTLTGSSVSPATAMSTFSGASATPWDINDQGTAVGQALNANGETVACSWPSPTSIVNLGLGKKFSAAQSINNLGEIAGYYMQDGSTPVGFLLRGGSLQLLDDSQSTKAGAINDLGRAVANYVSLTENRPFTKSGMTVLPLPQVTGGSFAEGIRINNRNQVIGSVVLTDDREQAALWDEGRLTVLGDLGGGFSQALGINNFNQIVGVSHVPAPSTVAVPAGSSSLTSGTSSITFANEPGRAFYCNGPGSAPVNLNTLIPSTSKWILLSATAINDRGQIVGYGLVDKATTSQTSPTYALRGYVLVPRSGQAPVPSLQLSLPQSAGTEGVRQDEAVQIAANANHAVAKIRILLDGVELQTLQSGPYVYQFNQTVLGTHRIRLESLNAQNQVVLSTEKDLVIRDLYWGEWRYKYFGSDTSPATDLAGDKDGDGIDNLSEYAFDLHPLQPSAVPQIGLETGSPISLSYRRRKAYDRQGLRYELEYSTNLKDWYSANGLITPESQTSEGPSSPTELVRVDFSAPSTEAPSYFFKMRIGKN